MASTDKNTKAPKKGSARNGLARARRVLAGLSLLAVTALFLDLSGALHGWLGWLAKLQLLPAIMAANLAVIAGIAVVTLLFGRIYCSVICPLGIFQDGVSWLSGLRSGKRAPGGKSSGGKHSGGSKKLRFGWKPERKWLRYTVFGVFVLALVFGVHVLVAVLAPYSAYGRMVGNLLQPLWLWGNNLLAKIAEHYDSYAFYTRDVWLKSLPTLIVAAATFVVLSVLAWWNGREYCNSVCPVGTALSFLSRFAMFRPTIDADKCKGCKLCEKGCKASCIDVANHKIDYSRCVDCLDCLGACKFDALHYKFAWGKTAGAEGADAEAAGEDAGAKTAEAKASEEGASAVNVQKNCTLAAKSANNARNVQGKMHVKSSTGENEGLEGADARVARASGGTAPYDTPADPGRRAFLTGTAMLAGALTLDAQKQKFDGGFARVIPKREPAREGRLVPPGARSANDFYSRCTACGLCVAACPNGVLRPSGDLEHLMQPYMSFERGFCRPECTECSQVCPTGAILPITPEEKTDISIGIAAVNYDLCVVNRDGVNCANCARHCPTGAIHMVKPEGAEFRVPSVDASLCIGCGRCEYLCPSRPHSAIRVNGREKHINSSES